MKLLRILLLVVLFLISAYAGYFVYEFVFGLIDFQLDMYEMYLGAGESLEQFSSFVGNLGSSLFGNADSPENVDTLRNNSLGNFEKKLRIFSAVVGLIGGLIVWKILFDIITGFTTTISRAKRFILGQ